MICQILRLSVQTLQTFVILQEERQRSFRTTLQAHNDEFLQIHHPGTLDSVDLERWG